MSTAQTISVNVDTIRALVIAYKGYQSSRWHNPQTDLGSFMGFLQEQLALQSE